MGGGAKQYLDILQQVLHVSHCEAIEEGIRLMHLHSQVIVLSADVLGQQVNGLGPSIPDSNLGAARSRWWCQSPSCDLPPIILSIGATNVGARGRSLACRGW